MAQANQPEPKICLKVEDEDKSVKYFRIRKTTPLRKLMKAYCKDVSIPRDKVFFVFKLRIVMDSNTPDTYGMKDGDKIKVYVSHPSPLSSVNKEIKRRV